MDMSTGGPQCLQQTIDGGGVFDGSPFGFAKATISHSGASFIVRAAEDGAAGNDYKVTLVNPRYANANTPVKYDEATKTLYVWLKHSGSAITGTAAEVVAAIEGSRKRHPFRAALVSDGTMAASTDNALAGGFNATLVGGIYRYDRNDGTNGGMFYFGREARVITRIEGRFADDDSLVVQIVNVDPGFQVIAPEDVTIHQESLSGGDMFVLADKEYLLMPGQALLVSMDKTGYVRVYSHRYDALG